MGEVFLPMEESTEHVLVMAVEAIDKVTILRKELLSRCGGDHVIFPQKQNLQNLKLQSFHLQFDYLQIQAPAGPNLYQHHPS